MSTGNCATGPRAGMREHDTARVQPLARFAIEKPPLARLPDIPPVLATWSEVKDANERARRL